MALDNYANLKAEIISFAGRDDLSSKVDTFIDLAESQMYNNRFKTLLLDDFETTTTLVTIGGTNAVALPATYLGQRTLTIQSGGVECELIYNAPSALKKYSTNGFPTHYTVEGTNIVFDSTPDDVYNLEFVYFAKPLPLDSSNPVNSVLTKYPDIYLWGALSNVYKFTSEPEDAASYYNEFIQAIRGAVKGSNKRKFPRPQSKPRVSAP